MNKKYIHRVTKKLQCSTVRKKEIEKQLMSEITAEVESGEALQDVLKRMGTPEELSAEFNNSFSEEEKKKYKKEKWAKRIIAILAILIVVVGAVYCFLPKTSPIEESKIFDASTVQEMTEQVIELVDAENYEELKKYADNAMIDMLNEDVIGAAKDMVSENWGERQSLGNIYMAECRQMGMRNVLVQINASYENANVTYSLSFDEDMELNGLWMK